MQWNLVDLSAYIVAGARRGGPLGVFYRFDIRLMGYAC